MDVISQVRDENVSNENSTWYRVFKAKSDAMGTDLANSSITVIDLAQQILKSPFKGTLEFMESLK